MFSTLIPRIISGFGFGFGMGTAMKIWNGLDRFLFNTSDNKQRRLK